MKRTIEQWKNCNPESMARKQSEAALMFAFQDAKADISALHKAVSILVGDDEDSDYMTTAEQHQFARNVLAVET